MSQPKSNRKIFLIGVTVAAIMFAFCFAIVPLYGLICKTTGINTAASTGELVTPTAANAIDATPDLSHEVTVQFIAMNHMGLPWDFYPQVKSITVHPGEKHTVYFYAKNTTDHLMTVQAIPSMTPTDVISHFHKIECFCFRQQTLKARASKNMALVFQIDKDLPKQIRVMTLAYTLFDATNQAAKKG